MDRIITNTNNRCRTLFKCQMESGDRGKYNLIRESTILSLCFRILLHLWQVLDYTKFFPSA